jgi:hypothetical protein
MRNGLIHASISRPVQMPIDTTPALDLFGLAAGWAVRTARSLLLATHQAVKLDPPIWLEKPEILPQES